MIFESWDIAGAVVAHMVNQGITDFYIVDHRSSGDPRDRFLREIPAEAKIRWVRKNSPLFSQATTMTALAHLARKDGFDAFVPFDADEFFTGKSRPLIDEVRDWLATTNTRALLCVMENFYQSRDVEDFTAADLAQVHYLAQRGANRQIIFSIAALNLRAMRFPHNQRKRSCASSRARTATSIGCCKEIIAS